MQTKGQCFRNGHLRLFIILKRRRIYSFGAWQDMGLQHQASSSELIISQQNMYCYFSNQDIISIRRKKSQGSDRKGGRDMVKFLGLFETTGMGVSLGILSLELQFFF